MQFNDTTNLTGGIQLIERLTNMGDGAISGNTTKLKQFTAAINDGFDELMPRLLAYSNFIRWDDLNHTDQPIGTFNIVSGTSDYQVKEDDNSLDILNITRIKILTSATETKYTDLDRMTIDDDRATNAMSPNSDETGTPQWFLERNNTIYLYYQPDYSATNGVKMWFEREPAYFDSTDTTKEPGVPKPFQQLPFLYAALEWLLINKANNTTLITRVESKIAKKEKALDEMITKRNPVRLRMTASTVDTR